MVRMPDDDDDEEKLVRWTAYGILALILLVMLGAGLLHAELAYGDWRCVIAKCVMVSK